MWSELLAAMVGCSCQASKVMNGTPCAKDQVYVRAPSHWEISEGGCDCLSLCLDHRRGFAVKNRGGRTRFGLRGRLKFKVIRIEEDRFR